MLNYVLLLVLVAGMFAPVAAIHRKIVSGKRVKYALALNIISFGCLCVLSMAGPLSGVALAAGEAAAGGAADSLSAAGLGYLSAAMSTGLACIGAGIAVASAASSAIGAMSEDPKIMGKAIIFVALAEGIALYGMLISIQILNKL